MILLTLLTQALKFDQTKGTRDVGTGISYPAGWVSDRIIRLFYIRYLIWPDNGIRNRTNMQLDLKPRSKNCLHLENANVQLSTTYY